MKTPVKLMFLENMSIYPGTNVFVLQVRGDEIFSWRLSHLCNNYYLYRMIRKTILFLIVLVLSSDLCNSQAFIKTADLFKRSDGAGSLIIIQNQAIDSLLSRYILSNKKHQTADGQGMPGYRIQIYYSSVRNAREESAKTIAQFMNRFPDIKPYAQYQEPGYFLVRVGDYRTKIEGYKDLIMIRKEFPNAYSVPTTINFPDQKKE